jgi:hypothetical protein
MCSLPAALVPFTVGVWGVMGARTPSEAPQWTTYAWLAAALFVLSCPTLYALRWVLNRVYDPNKTIPEQERIHRGRERALTPEQIEKLR